MLLDRGDRCGSSGAGAKASVAASTAVDYRQETGWRAGGRRLDARRGLTDGGSRCFGGDVSPAVAANGPATQRPRTSSRSSVDGDSALGDWEDQMEMAMNMCRAAAGERALGVLAVGSSPGAKRLTQ
jgi:hypothetical protein